MSDDKSGVELQAAVGEARQWIEAVTGKQLVGEFRESLEDGIVLCELINELNPGCIRKINVKNIAIAHLDNIKQFLSGCETLGLKDSQLFDLTDLQAPGTLRMKSGGVKHTTADRRLRNVVITLYWLGRKVAQTPSYMGPQLDLEAFKEILDIPNQNYYLKGYDGNGSSSPVQPRPNLVVTDPPPPPPSTKTNHAPLPPPTVPLPKPTIAAPVKLAKPVSAPKTKPVVQENGDISAEELMANIQSVVDELNLDYRSLSNGSPEVRKNSPVTPPLPPAYNSSPEGSSPSGGGGGDENISFTTKVTAAGGSLGLQIIGGADSAVPAQIELLLPGGPAESSGLAPHDLIVSINGRDVSGHNHFDLISLIKQSSTKGFVTMGVVRRPPSADSLEGEEDGPQQPFQRTESQIIWEEEHMERERQRQEVAMLYNKRSEVLPTGREEEEEEEEVNWEEMLDEQLQWQNSGSSKPLDDLQHQLDALRVLAERKPSPGNDRKSTPGSDRKSSPEGDGRKSSSPGTTAMSTIKPYQEQEKEVRQEVRQETREEEEEDESTPVASDNEQEEEEEEPVDAVRGEGEGREADPIIITHTDRRSSPSPSPPPPPPLTDEDPFAPLKKTPSTQSELLSEVLSAHTSLANGFHHHTNTSITTPSSSVTRSSYVSSYTTSPSSSVTTPPSSSVTLGGGNSRPREDTSAPRFSQFTTPNARVVKMDFNGQDSEEVLYGGVKVKAVQKTRWTPEMKAKQRTTPTQRTGIPVAPPTTTTPDDKYEVVVTDPRGRSLSYGAPDEHRIHHTSRPNSGQVKSAKGPPNCTRCRGPITSGPMMSIPARKINFHSKCLICVVCRLQITMGYGHTTVFLRHSLPHCASCYSTDNGIKATTC